MDMFSNITMKISSYSLIKKFNPHNSIYTKSCFFIFTFSNLFIHSETIASLLFLLIYQLTNNYLPLRNPFPTIHFPMNKSFIIFSLIFTCLIMNQVTSLRFSIQIEGSQSTCFSHLITESTPFQFSVEGDHSDFDLLLKFKDGTELLSLIHQQPLKKIDSYAAVTEHYNFCINNRGDKQQFIITFFHGLQLSDIALLPKQEDHQLIDKLVDELNGIYQSVRSQQLYMKTVNEYNMELQKMVSFKYVGFGFLSITVVLIIGFLHYLEIKRVLRTRKVI